MDEIDAIGGRRFSEGTSADREIQRTLMELLNQLDGFDQLGKVYFTSKSQLTCLNTAITLDFFKHLTFKANFNDRELYSTLFLFLWS